VLRLIFCLFYLIIAFSGPAIAQANPVQLSFLPQGRSGQPNIPVTVFGTVVNSSDDALDCAPRFGGFLGGLPTGVTGQLKFYPWDGTNITGTANQIVTLAAGGRQDYIVEANFDREFTGLVSIIFRCTNDSGTHFDAPQLPAVNALAFDIQTTLGTDIIVINSTLTNDGVARVGATGPRASLMTIAAINIGAAGTDLIAEAGITGFSALHDGLDITVCETDAAGVCLSQSARQLPIANWGAGETRLFAVRAHIPPGMGVPFYPDILRLIFLVRPESTAAGNQLSSPSEVGLSDYSRFGLTHTGAAVEASPSESNLNSRLRLSFDMTCETDTGVSSGARFRVGAAVVSPNGVDTAGLVAAWEMRNFSLESYGQVVLAQFPHQAGNGSFIAEVYGSGDVDQVEADTELQMNYFYEPLSSLRIGWAGSASFRNDFQDSGRVRCAAAPAQPLQPSNDNVVESMRGRFDVTPPFDDGIVVEFSHEIDLFDEQGGRTSLGLEFGPAPVDSYADGFMAALQLIGNGQQTGNSNTSISAISQGDTAGYVIPQKYSSDGAGGVQVDCAVMMLTGLPTSEADPQSADKDAGAYILIREGLTLTEAELEECAT